MAFPPGSNPPPQIMFGILMTSMAIIHRQMEEFRERMLGAERHLEGLGGWARTLKESVVPTMDKMTATLEKVVALKAQETAAKTTTLWGMFKAVPQFFYVGTFKNAALSLMSLEPLKAGLWTLLGTGAWTGTLRAVEQNAPEPIADAVRTAKKNVGGFLWYHVKPHAVSAGKSAAYYGATGTANAGIAVGQAAFNDMIDSVGSAVYSKSENFQETLKQIPVFGDFFRGANKPKELSLKDRVQSQLDSSSSRSRGESDLPALAILVATAGLAYIAFSKFTRQKEAEQLKEEFSNQRIEEPK